MHHGFFVFRAEIAKLRGEAVKAGAGAPIVELRLFAPAVSVSKLHRHHAQPIERFLWCGHGRAKGVLLRLVVTSGFDVRDEGGAERGRAKANPLQHNPIALKHRLGRVRGNAGRRTIDMKHFCVGGDGSVLQHDPVGFYGQHAAETDDVFDPPQLLQLAITYDRTMIRGRRNSRITSKAALAVAVASPPMPEDYPKNGAEIVSYLRREAPEAVTMLAQLADPAHAAIDVILMSKTPDGGPVAAAMVLLRPKPQSRGPGRASADPMTRGFRQVLPADVALSRYTGGFFRAAEVERADRDWIHGRDVDPDARRLASASVLILGGGSLGAPAAESLAHAGVGEINVVDPKALRFGTLGRHTLSARSVRENKAIELVADMKRALPHLKGQGYPIKFQKFRDDHHDVLSSANLIISAMGDWQAEGLLNAWRLEQMAKPPIVFGWAEDHACAGHAVAIVDARTCFACGMEPNGEQRLRLTRWPGPTLVNEPGCGAHFQPYGQIEISRVAQSLAELAIAVLLGKVSEPTHRIWAAPAETLQNAGGEWSPEWLAAGGRPEGGYLTSRPWGSGVCWQCGRRAA